MIENQSSSSILTNLAHLGIVIYLVFYVLSIGQQFIIPFLIALFLTSLIVGLGNFFHKHVRNYAISYFLSISSIVIILYFVAQIFTSNYAQLMQVAPMYQQKITLYVTQLDSQYKVFEKINIKTLIGYVDFPTLVQFFGNTIASFLANASVVFLYTLFLLLEYRYFTEKMRLLASKSRHEWQILLTVHQVREDISSYFFLKTLVAFMIGAACYVVMVVVGLDFALFWAFLLFVLDFIPNIGSLIAMFFPIAFGFVQFDSLSYPLANMLGIIAVQTVISNVVAPKIMGNKLNLSALVIMLSLGFWGILWGGIGLVLAMPIMVSLNIIFSKFSSTQWLAILMSEKGELKTDFTFDMKEKKSKKLLARLKEKMGGRGR